MTPLVCTVAERSVGELGVLATAAAFFAVGLWLKRRTRKIPGNNRVDTRDSPGFPPKHFMRVRRMVSEVEYKAETKKREVGWEKRYPEICARLRETAQYLAKQRGEPITSDDVHEEHPIAAGIEPRIMAVAFTPKHLWEHVGYRKSKRPERQGGIVAVWKLRDVA